MRYKKLKALIIFLFILQVTSVAQSNENVFSGLGLEIGVGQNNLFWTTPFNIKTPGGVATDRTYFSIVPNIRINYYAIHSILLFIGYNQLGGSSNEDKYTIDTIEFGSFFLIKISNIFIGLGGKLNSHQSVQYHFSSFDLNRSDWFSKMSGDIGIRASYLLNHFSFSLETWFGLTNLSAGPLSDADIHQNHYRFLIGYTL